MQQPWYPNEVQKLMALVRTAIDVKEKIPWDIVASECGRTQRSCQQKYVQLKAKERLDEIRARANRKPGPKRRVIAPMPVAVRLPKSLPRPPARTTQCIDAPRSNSIASLSFAAEMRARIGAQGITAGLMGDPPQGRSALDKKRAETSA